MYSSFILLLDHSQVRQTSDEVYVLFSFAYYYPEFLKACCSSVQGNIIHIIWILILISMMCILYTFSYTCEGNFWRAQGWLQLFHCIPYTVYFMSSTHILYSHFGVFDVCPCPFVFNSKRRVMKGYHTTMMMSGWIHNHDVEIKVVTQGPFSITKVKKCWYK